MTDAEHSPRPDHPSPARPGAEPELTTGRYLTEIWLPGVRLSLRPGTYASYDVNVLTHMVPGLWPIHPGFPARRCRCGTSLSCAHS